MRNLLFAILSTFALQGFCQSKIAFTKLIKKNNGLYYYNDTLYTGETLILWPISNKPMQRITWTAGQIDGTFKSWYENGKQDQVIGYSKGVRHGEFKTFYRNGAPEVRCGYNNGIYLSM